MLKFPSFGNVAFLFKILILDFLQLIYDFMALDNMVKSPAYIFSVVSVRDVPQWSSALVPWLRVGLN